MKALSSTASIGLRTSRKPRPLNCSTTTTTRLRRGERWAGRRCVDKDGNKLLDGIRSVQEFEKIIAEVKARGYEAGQTPKQIADDVAILQEMFDRIRGVPHTMAGTSLDQSMEIARNAATAIFGGSFGLSALMDIGRLSSLAGVKAMLQHMPAFRREIVEGGVLKPGSPLVRDLQAAFAYAEEFRPLSPRFDPATVA